MFSSARGFTLIELLVVIAIIAILSVVGIAAFKGVTGGARDSTRRADIDAIAKAYEIQKTSGYIALSDSQFASGKKPQDPNSQKGDYFNWLAQDGSGFKVCASLDNNPNTVCNTPALNCYCKFSSQGTIASGSVAAPSSTQTTIGLGGSSASSCDPNGTLYAGLIGYWKMDEASWNGTAGEVKDWAGSNHGTAAGGANTTPGKFGQAGNFDGSNDYIELGNPALFNSNFAELTVEAWLNSNQWAAWPIDYGMDVLISKWDRQAGDIDVGFRLERIYGAGPFGIIVSSGVDTGGINASVPISTVSTGVWHHAVGTFKGGSFIRLYLDGVLVNEQTTGIYAQVTAAINQNLRIGVMSHGYGFFNGLIDDVRIYNRALSPQEVSSLWSSGNGCI